MILLKLLALPFTVLHAASAQLAIDDGASFEDFALAARPYWKLSQANGHDTCWPSYALNGTNQVVPPAELEEWPQADGGGCPKPTSRFPVYWNARKCSDDEIRVHYSLFFKKDGFAFLNTDVFGHAYDWERVIVVYTRNLSVEASKWTRSRALYSQHSGYGMYNWEDLQTSDRGNLDSLGTNNDHPTVFIAWAKHSMYKEKQDKLCSIVDELTDNAFRDDHYKYFNSPEELIEVANNTAIWNIFKDYETWGKATSVPNVIYEKLCEVSA